MILRRQPIIAGIALACLALAACAPKIIPAGWIRLAHQEIAFNASRSVIPVPPAAPAVKSLLIAARMNDIDITHVRVLFDDGAIVERADRAKLLSDRDTVVLDLPRGRHRIREIVVQYFKLNNVARRAVVEIWGDPR
jgi:hypothetical protein